MTSKQVGKTRLLFVLSSDFGELGNALYLLQGGAFSPLLLLPERLFATNETSLGVPVRRYQSLQDILVAVDEMGPEVIFLFSGYLYAVNNVFSIDIVGQLVCELTARNCRVVTSDPFLGVLATVNQNTFSDNHPYKQFLTNHFARLVTIFKDIPHLYLVDRGTNGDRETLSFFNKNIFRLPVAASPEMRDKSWLFILSLEDYGMQTALLGTFEFDRILLENLRQTEKAGRRPVVVGPQTCLSSLTTNRSSLERLTLVPFCGYEQFLSLCLQAEYVFYWNIFSNSIAVRVMNRLPIFFFHHGHMVHALPSLREAALTYYYPGSTLPFIDQLKGVHSDELTRLAAQQDGTFAAARDHFQRSPTPEQLIVNILARVPSPKP